MPWEGKPPNQLLACGASASGCREITPEPHCLVGGMVKSSLAYSKDMLQLSHEPTHKLAVVILQKLSHMAKQIDSPFWNFLSSSIPHKYMVGHIVAMQIAVRRNFMPPLTFSKGPTIWKYWWYYNMKGDTFKWNRYNRSFLWKNTVPTKFKQWLTIVMNIFGEAWPGKTSAHYLMHFSLSKVAIEVVHHLRDFSTTTNWQHQSLHLLLYRVNLAMKL